METPRRLVTARVVFAASIPPHETKHPHVSFFDDTFPTYARTCPPVLCVHYCMAHLLVGSVSSSYWDSCSVWAALDAVLKSVLYSCHLVNQRSVVVMFLFPGRRFSALFSDLHLYSAVASLAIHWHLTTARFR